MHFKLAHLLKELNSELPEAKVRLRSGDVSVTFRRLTEKERAKYKKSNLIYCEAVAKKEISDGVARILERLQNHQMPEGFRKPLPESPAHPDLYPNVDENGNIRPKSTPSIVLFPDDFKSFYLDVLDELTESIRRSVKILRWRLGARGSHSPTESTLGMVWSQNGRTWRKMPFDIIVNLEFQLRPRLSEAQLQDIKNLIRRGDQEPLAHELFLEAWELRNTNPRSSLVVGIAAAEVGIKQCISKLAPDAKWLADNSPSPPIMSILKNYLPMLPAKLRIRDRILPPPKSIRTALSKGVELRNKTTHVGQDAPPGKDLEELLLAIRDLLYLLDFYCGFKWSEENIRRETIEEMRGEYDL